MQGGPTQWLHLQQARHLGYCLTGSLLYLAQMAIQCVFFEVSIKFKLLWSWTVYINGLIKWFLIKQSYYHNSSFESFKSHCSLTVQARQNCTKLWTLHRHFHNELCVKWKKKTKSNVTGTVQNVYLRNAHLSMVCYCALHCSTFCWRSGWHSKGTLPDEAKFL